jgi:hypothetical protein
MKFIPNNKNTMENRRITFRRNNTLPHSQKKDIEIVSAINIALHAAGAPYRITITDISTKVRGMIMAVAGPNASADMLVAWKEVVVVKAARHIDQGIIDIEKNEDCEKVKMHGISFDQYAAQKSGGVEKLRQLFQAENEGVVIPMAINWLGRPADIMEKRKSGEKDAMSVVISIKAKKVAQKCLEKGLRVAGVWYEVERYIRAEPDAFCESCCWWDHHVSQCGRLTMEKYMLYAGSHETEDHVCDVMGCKAKKGQNCPHNNNK